MEKSMSTSILHEYTTPTHWDETSDASVPRRRDGTREESNLNTTDHTTDKREVRLRSVPKIWIKTSGNQIRKPRRLGSTLQIFYASYEPIGSCCSRSRSDAGQQSTHSGHSPTALRRRCRRRPATAWWRAVFGTHSAGAVGCASTRGAPSSGYRHARSAADQNGNGNSAGTRERRAFSVRGRSRVATSICGAPAAAAAATAATATAAACGGRRACPR